MRVHRPEDAALLLALSPSPPNLEPVPGRQQGVEVLGAEQEGWPFDPEVHEAVMRQPPPPGMSDDDVVKVRTAACVP